MVHWFHELQLAGAILLTALAKHLMTDEGPEEGETKEGRAMRHRRALGGVITGVLVAYYGHPVAIRLLGLHEEDRIIVAIVLAMTAEHMARWLIGNAPVILTRLTGGHKP